MVGGISARRAPSPLSPGTPVAFVKSCHIVSEEGTVAAAAVIRKGRLGYDCISLQHPGAWKYTGRRSGREFAENPGADAEEPVFAELHLGYVPAFVYRQLFNPGGGRRGICFRKSVQVHPHRSPGYGAVGIAGISVKDNLGACSVGFAGVVSGAQPYFQAGALEGPRIGPRQGVQSFGIYDFIVGSQDISPADAAGVITGQIKLSACRNGGQRNEGD